MKFAQIRDIKIDFDSIIDLESKEILTVEKYINNSFIEVFSGPVKHLKTN